MANRKKLNSERVTLTANGKIVLPCDAGDIGITVFNLTSGTLTLENNDGDTLETFQDKDQTFVTLVQPNVILNLTGATAPSVRVSINSID